MQNPLVSIIIPLYNAESFIFETINFALAQTYKNIEIIIIDDGSTDNSLAVAKQFESEKIKVYAQENKGASAARNLGLRQAKGDYMQFLDADDLLSPTKIEEQINYLIHNPNNLVYCNTKIFKSDKNLEALEDCNLSAGIENTTDPYQFLLKLYGGYGDPSMVTVHAWLTPKALIEKSGNWNESLTMDDDGEFFCRVILSAQRIHFCDNIFAYYRKHEHNNNLSAQRTREHFSSELMSIRLKTQNLLNKRESQQAKIAMSFWYIRLAILAYPKFRKISNQALQEIKILNIRPTVPILGGKVTELIKKLLGWRFVRILQHLTLK